MAIVFGAHPGGKNAFALAGLYYNGRLPASLIVTRSFSSVGEAKNHIVGVVGEWGGLDVVGIDAPLSWSPDPSGVRACDVTLKKRLPGWAPRTWYKAAGSMPAAQSVQGPALAWALADEFKHQQLPQHQIVETPARLSLSIACQERKDDLLKLADRTAKDTRPKLAARLVEHFVESGVLRVEVDTPVATSEGIEAIMSAVTALAVAAPDIGLVTPPLDGGTLRPFGTRPVVVLEALP
jgi:hypothetical protein